MQPGGETRSVTSDERLGSRRIVRVVRLYRHVVGWQWWVQFGFWYPTAGPMGIATGNPKLGFSTIYEKYFPNEEAALKRKPELEKAFAKELQDGIHR